MYQKLKLRDLASGQSLRNYRKRLASYSQAKNSVLTTKFKLQIQDNTDSQKYFAEFDRCRILYDTIEGCSKGSLTYFLFSLILSGFRIFASAPEAVGFVNRSAYDEASFQQAWEDTVGKPLPAFTIEKLFKRLKTEVRARGTKDNSFVEEIINREYRNTLCKSLPRGADAEKVSRIFEEISKELASHFSSWQDIKKDLPAAVSEIDDVLKKFGTFPSLQKALDSSEVSLPDSSTIAFDSNAKFLHLDEENKQYAQYMVVSTILNYSEKQKSDDPAKFVSQHLTTDSASGLSWLFNKGLELFQQSTVEQLCEFYSVPFSERERVIQVKEAALAVNSQKFLFKGKNSIGYHEFRSSFTGRTDSWTTNYIKRLQELLSIVRSLDDELKLPELYVNGEDFLETTDCKREEIELLCRQFSQNKNNALEALENLLGNNPTSVVNDIRLVEECRQVINRLFAVKEQIKNALVQASEDKTSSWKNLYSHVKDELSRWDNLEQLPKLNQMSGGVPDYKKELTESKELCKQVLNAQRKHFQEILDWAQQNHIVINVPKAIAENEKRRNEKRLNGKFDVNELAIRRILQRFASLVRDRSDECAQDLRNWFKEQEIFANTKDFNKFFFNHLGSIYVSPFSTRRHQGYLLSAKYLEDSSRVWDSLKNFVLTHRSAYAPFSLAYETYLRMESLLIGMTVSAIPQMVPTALAKPRLGDEVLKDSLHESLRLQIRQSQIDSSVLAKVFNVYSSLISGALIVLRREKFFLRTKFLWVGNNALIYVPKDKEWDLPQTRYAKSEKWKKIFASGVIVRNESGRVDTLKTFALIGEAINNGQGRFLGELLRQLPHDWCYELPIQSPLYSKKYQGSSEFVDTLNVQKKGKFGTELSYQKKYSNALARLVGPCSFKERLDVMLLDNSVTIGDMNLLADQEVKQSLIGTQIQLEKAKLEYSLAIPIKTPIKNTDYLDTKPFKRVVAIDQGEAGFAFAVFNLDDAGNPQAQPLTCGTVSIPSIRRLIKTVRSYRKGKQKAQKFSQRFDSSMFTLRENVAGDVCGAIAGLMSRYQAIPVLERQVTNLASGGKQLELVYKMVNSRFLIDGIPAHQQERSAWWYGLNVMYVSGIWSEISPEFAREQKKKTEILEVGEKFYRTLLIGPGAGVNAKWTSRICSHCFGNISELIQQAQESGIREVSLNSEGETTLLGRTVKLYRRPSESEGRQARRRNERASWTVPLSNVTMSLDDFRKAALSNLRRAPRSLQSKDTTQSRYFCVFKDCEYHNREQHADINAAINIGRRFLDSILKKEID